jgi:23S rRNA (guanosine2251-2'-O)-methyltransferase
MIVYGLNPVMEALKAHPERVRWVGIGRQEGGKVQRAVDEARRRGVSVRQLPSEELERLSGRRVHNGVVAELAEGGYADFEDKIGGATFVLLLDGIQDPQNLGAILRVADGAGVGLVVIPEHESAAVTAGAIKASAGASEWVPVAQVTNLSRAIERLKEEKFWVYAAAAEGDPFTEVDLRGKVAIVMGSEEKGVRRNVLTHCDRKISIPMRGKLSSLNVATAAAVLCYEVVRQNGEQ